MRHRLLEAARERRVPHALILAGGDHAAAVLLARRAAALYCLSSPDTKLLNACNDYFELGQTPIKIGELRELLSELAKRAFGEGPRAVLLHSIGAGQTGALCQNALLKTLEEPPPQTLFLFTGSYHLYLPTLRSRCCTLYLPPLTEREIMEALMEKGAGQAEALEAARLCGGSLERAENLCLNEDYKALRSSVLETFLSALSGDLPFNDVKRHKEGKTSLEAVVLMLSFARDMLLLKETGRAKENLDFSAKLSEYTKNFTSAQMNVIIETLAGAHRRLQLHAPAAAVLEWLFIQISEVLALS